MNDDLRSELHGQIMSGQKNTGSMPLLLRATFRAHKAILLCGLVTGGLEPVSGSHRAQTSAPSFPHPCVTMMGMPAIPCPVTILRVPQSRMTETATFI